MNRCVGKNVSLYIINLIYVNLKFVYAFIEIESVFVYLKMYWFNVRVYFNDDVYVYCFNLL